MVELTFRDKWCIYRKALAEAKKIGMPLPTDKNPLASQPVQRPKPAVNMGVRTLTPPKEKPVEAPKEKPVKAPKPKKVRGKVREPRRLDHQRMADTLNNAESSHAGKRLGQEFSDYSRRPKKPKSPREEGYDPGGFERTRRERHNYPEGPKPHKSPRDEWGESKPHKRERPDRYDEETGGGDWGDRNKSNEFRTFTKNLNAWADNLINKIEFDKEGKVIHMYPKESIERTHPAGTIDQDKNSKTYGQEIGGKKYWQHPKRVYPKDSGKHKPQKDSEKKPTSSVGTPWDKYDPSHRKEINEPRYDYDLYHNAQHQKKIQENIARYKEIVEGQKHPGEKPGMGDSEGSRGEERPRKDHSSPYLSREGKIPHGLHGKIEESKNPKKDEDKPYHFAHQFGQHPTSVGTPATHRVHGPNDYTEKLRELTRKPYISDIKHPSVGGKPNLRSQAGYKLSEEEQQTTETDQDKNSKTFGKKIKTPYGHALSREAKRVKDEKYEKQQRKINPNYDDKPNPYKPGKPGYEMEEYFRSPEYKKKALYIQWLKNKAKKYEDTGPNKNPIKDQSTTEEKRQAKIVQDDLALNARKYEGSHAEKEDEYIKNLKPDPLSSDPHGAQKSYDQIIKDAEESLRQNLEKDSVTGKQSRTAKPRPGGQTSVLFESRGTRGDPESNRLRTSEGKTTGKKHGKWDFGSQAQSKEGQAYDARRSNLEGPLSDPNPGKKGYSEVTDEDTYDHSGDIRDRDEGASRNISSKSDVEHGKYSNPGSTPEVGVSTDTKVDVPTSTGYEERPHISVEEAGKLPRATFNPHGNNELHVSGSQSGKDQPKFKQPTSQNQPVRKVGVPEQHPNSYGVRYGMKGGVKKVWCPEHQIWEETTKDWHD